MALFFKGQTTSSEQLHFLLHPRRAFKVPSAHKLLPSARTPPFIGSTQLICIDVIRGCRSIRARAFIGSAAVTFAPLMFSTRVILRHETRDAQTPFFPSSGSRASLFFVRLRQNRRPVIDSCCLSQVPRGPR